jgi:hypothetical protein
MIKPPIDANAHWTEDTLFPLTPALSLGEREKCSSSPDDIAL